MIMQSEMKFTERKTVIVSVFIAIFMLSLAPFFFYMHAAAGWLSNISIMESDNLCYKSRYYRYKIQDCRRVT